MSGHRSCVFKSEWTLIPEYKDWVQGLKDQPHRAYCGVCQKSFDIGNMGVAALKSHKKGQSHIKSASIAAQRDKCGISGYLTRPSEQKKTETASASETLPAAERSSGTLASKSSDASDALNAEILWAMKVVMSHFSFNSCNELSELFVAMFPDSDIARSFTCAATKCAYLICFGLAPYFTDKLIEQIRRSDAYVVSFDECLNKVSQRGQMDIVIRFWNLDAGKVATRYLGSEFLGHAAATNLLDSFKTALEKLDPKKMLQVSMDGPSVNWKFLTELKEDRKNDPTVPELIDIGCCGLHVIHGAFQCGAEASGWKTGQKLRAAWQLFHDTPARREDYTRLTNSTTFPLKFCAHRWVEDLPVAERAVEIWANVTTFIDSFKGSPKSKIPTSASFNLVKEAVGDSMFLAKLQFFISIAKQLQPFLNKFQADAPMVPFLAEELHSLISALLARFIKPDVIANAKSAAKLVGIEVNDKKQHLKAQDVDLGFATKQELKKVHKRKDVSDLMVLEFRMQCIEFLVTMTAKMLQRCPLRYPVVSKLKSLDPRHMAVHPKDSTIKFEGLLEIVLNANLRTTSQCESISAQYKLLLQHIPQLKREFKAFGSEETDRVDVFFHNKMDDKPEFSDLWQLFKSLLCLSHGQADVERGFSINKEMLVENMKERTFVAQRMVYQNGHYPKSPCPNRFENILQLNANRLPDLSKLTVLDFITCVAHNFISRHMRHILPNATGSSKITIKQDPILQKEIFKMTPLLFGFVTILSYIDIII